MGIHLLIHSAKVKVMKLVRILVQLVAAVAGYGTNYFTDPDYDFSRLEKRHSPKMAIYGKRHDPAMATYDKRVYKASKATMQKLISQGIRNPGIMGLAKKLSMKYL